MTDFLFARPNLISGIGAAIDLGATMMMYNESHSPEEADALALVNDWAVWNRGVREAIEKELRLIA